MFEYMPDLWTVMVEMIFGGFWLSIVGLCLLFSVILMLGGLSSFSIMTFCLSFVLVMVMGYGYPIITIPLVTLIIGWSMFQIYKLIATSS